MAKIKTVMAMIFITRIALRLNREDLESFGFVLFRSMVRIYDGKFRKQKYTYESFLNFAYVYAGKILHKNIRKTEKKKVALVNGHIFNTDNSFEKDALVMEGERISGMWPVSAVTAELRARGVDGTDV